MNDRTDKQALKTLMSAMSQMREESEKKARKREEKLWQEEIRIPYRLDTALARLTKYQLDNIRKNLDLKSLSALKKQELIEELVQQIPSKAQCIFKLFDEERYHLAKKIVKNGGTYIVNHFPLEKVDYLMMRGFIFPGMINGKKVLTIPMELLQIFEETDNLQFRQLIKRNNEWIRLTHGLLYYYGVQSINQLVKRLENLTDQTIDLYEYYKVIHEAMEYFNQVNLHQTYLYDTRVKSPEKLVHEINVRPDIDYFPFTKKQLLQAGEPGYIDQTPYVKKLIEYLLFHYNIPRDEVNEVVKVCINIILSDGQPSNIINYLNSQFEFPAMEAVQEIVEMIMNLHNHTRMWVLKGYTPHELSRKEKPHLRPMPSIPLVNKQSESKVIDIQSRTKVGRNDPCPCGSGKKFKKCCDRNSLNRQQETT